MKKANSLYVFIFVLFVLTVMCQISYADIFQRINDKSSKSKEDAKKNREERIKSIMQQGDGKVVQEEQKTGELQNDMDSNESELVAEKTIIEKYSQKREEEKKKRGENINAITQQRDREVGQAEQELGELQKTIDSNTSKLSEERAIVNEYSLKIKNAPDFASEGGKRLSDEFEKSAEGQEAITQEMDIRLKKVLEQCKLQIDEKNIMDMLTEVYGSCSVVDMRKQHSSLEFEQAIMQFENISNDMGEKWLEDFKNKYPRITKGVKTTIRETSGKTYTGTIKNVTSKFVSIQQPKSPNVDKIELSSLDYYSKQRIKDEANYNSFVNEEYRMHKKSKKAGMDNDNIKFKMLLKLNYFPKMILNGEEFNRIPDNFFNINEWMKIEDCLDRFYKESFIMLSEEYVSKHGFHFHEGRGIWLPDEMESWENTLRIHKTSESQLKKHEDELLAQKKELENKISTIKFNAQRSIKNAESVYKKSIDEITSAERAAIAELKRKEAERERKRQEAVAAEERKKRAAAEEERKKQEEEEYQEELKRLEAQIEEDRQRQKAAAEEIRKKKEAQILENIKKDSEHRRYSRMCACINSWLTCQRKGENGSMYVKGNVDDLFAVESWEIVSDESVCAQPMLFKTIYEHDFAPPMLAVSIKVLVKSSQRDGTPVSIRWNFIMCTPNGQNWFIYSRTKD